MPTMDELLSGGPQTSFSANSSTGIQVLSEMGSITFDRYVRIILPSDGFVFWVKASMLSAGALAGAMLLNKVPLNKAAQFVTTATNTMTVQGSFHWDATSRQEEGQNYAAAQTVFTALAEVNDFKDVAPGTVWIAKQDKMTFAFSSQGYYYKVADKFHYRGYAVFSDLLTQVVDNMGLVQLGEQVVSNSLPIWLGFNSYQTFYGIKTAGVPLYPSYLVPDNLAPPYGSVHVLPESTTAYSLAPRLSGNFSHDQLCRETVRVTLTGVRNRGALDFQDFVNQYTLDNEDLGMVGDVPVVQDEKRFQPELSILAQRKVITFNVSYYQSVARDIARQLIKKSIPTYYFN